MYLKWILANRFLRPGVHGLLRCAYAVRRFHASLLRPVTLGVRALVLNDEGHVLLIRHTYAPGWYMPGGGVNRDETLPAAAIRELYEEAGIRATGDLKLVGVFANFLQLKSDHVVIYAVPDWEDAGPAPHLGFEIAETGFFAPGALPADTTPGTRLRLEEFFKGREPTVYW